MPIARFTASISSHCASVVSSTGSQVKHRGAVDERGEVPPGDLFGAGRRVERAFPVREVADQRVEGTGPAVCRCLDRRLELFPRAVQQNALRAPSSASPQGGRGAESTRGSGDEDPMPQELFAHQPGSTPRRR